ncbi:MAG: cyclase family protein [Pseudodesulfovibrio sp.]|nr:cyclase family protein [Pseudodesulfovibrio sp.]
MHVIDLSHTIQTGMPVFPGDDQVNVRRTHFVKKDGFARTSLDISSHIGTHVDVAAHLYADAPGLDWLGPDNFTGWGAVIDLTALDKPFIDQPDLAALGAMESLDFAILYTGWGQHWKTDQYFDDYPTLTETACRYLGGLQLKGIGLDTLSPDPITSRTLTAHKTLMDHGLVVVENLCNLNELPPEDFLFCCLPLKIRDGDGSPVRAVGITF